MRFVDTDLTEQIDLALSWAERGIPVMPIGIRWDTTKKQTNKRPLCTGGFYKASTEPTTIKELFRAAVTWTPAGDDEVVRVGIRPGSAGIVIVDIDRKGSKDGFSIVDDYDLPATFTVTTASGGEHWWYKKRDLAVSIGNAFTVVEGVDIRADNGLAVAPGVVTPWGDWVTFDDYAEDVELCPENLWKLLGRNEGGDERAASSFRRLTDEDRAKLHPEDLATLELIEAEHGGNHPVLVSRADGDPYVRITRSGKDGGTSASIGYVGPGVFKCFTSGWPPFAAEQRYDRHEIMEVSRRAADGAADPAALFDRAGLLHTQLVRRVLAEGPIRAGLGQTLWRYKNGVWLADGDAEARRRAGRILGDRRRNSHVQGVVSDLECQEPFITDDPPMQWVNCRNGLLDWMTSELASHTPEVPSTYQLAVDWNPAARCPTVDDWIATVFPDDAIELAWEVIGVAIAADTPVHRAVLLVGPGRNGKGTFLRLIQQLIPRQHRSSVTLQALSENKFAVAELYGKVANIAGDLDARSIHRTDMFKMATGGDPLTAERKYGPPFQFYNRATMLFSANTLPGTADLSDGFFSRFVVVPMDRLRLGPNDEDKTLEPRMWAELPGVLVKAVAGLRRVMVAGGFTLSQSVIDASAEYRVIADPVMQFVDEQMEVSGGAHDREPRGMVFERYRRWCDANGVRNPGRATDFYKRLPAVTAGQVRADFRSNGTDWVVGALLRRDVEAFV